MLKLLQKICSVIIIGSLLFACTNKNEVIYINPNYSIEERVDDLMSRMTLEEKVSQMRMFHANKGIDIDADGNMLMSEDVKNRLVNGIGGIKNPGEFNTPLEAAKLNNQLQRYIIENSRLGIPTFFVTESYNGVDAEGCTRFARPINMAATWNLQLVQRAYDQIGREARARGLHLTHSPEADIARDPRFGRMSEMFSEDTYLTTEMVVRAIKGMQGNNEGLSKTHIGAVTKHFAGYGQIAGGRNFASIEISPRTFIDEILPPFRAAVLRANTLGIMPSHGDINGVACHGDAELLTVLLRDDWGFEGYVVSDSNDVPRLFYFMKVAETAQEAAIMGLLAGVDMDLYSDDGYVMLPDIIKDRPELMKHIDRSARRVLRTKFILGLFDNPYADESQVDKITRNEAAIDLAHEVDLESVILLKNSNNILPLSGSQRTKVALVGPLLDSQTKQYFEEVAGDRATFVSEKGFSLTDGIPGVPNLTSEEDSKKGIQRIINVARGVDVVLLFVGGDEFTAKEAYFNNALGDRDNIDPVGQQDLLLEELKKLGKPVIVVLKHRRTLSINAIEEKADAILDCWDLSEIGDRAISKIVFGKAAPSGKLPVTVPRSIGQMPIHYSQKEINYKKDYLFTESTPLFPFGFGLSYTTFEYSNISLSDSLVNIDDVDLKVRVDVTNTGHRSGKEVVQLYIKDVAGSVLRPNMELKGFDKIELQPGESRTVTFSVTAEMLKFTDVEMKNTLEKGAFIVMVGASSGETLKKSFVLTDSNR